MTWLSCFTAVLLLHGDICGAFEFKEKNCNTAKPDGITEDASFDQAPFRVRMDSATYSPGIAYTVTIQSTGIAFQNAMLMTVCGWCPPYGIFVQDSVASTTFNCDGETSSGIIASTNSPRTTYSVRWTPKDNVADKLRFTATIVYNDTLWWSGVESDVYRRATREPEQPESEPDLEPAPTDPVTEPPIEPAPTETTQTSGSESRLTHTEVFASSQVISMFLGVLAFL